MTENFIYDLIGELAHSMRRFFPSQFFINMLFFFGSIAIASQGPKKSILNRISLTLFLGFLICILGTVVCENHQKIFSKFKNGKIISKIILFFLGLIPYFFIKNVENVYFMLGYLGVCFSLAFLIIYVSCIKNFSKVFTFFLIRLIGVTFCTILIAVITSLFFFIFNFVRDSSNFVPLKINLLFWFSIIFLTFVTISIPDENSNLEAPKIFWDAILKFVLPVYMLFFVIFSLYGIKTLIIGGAEFFTNFELFLSIIFSTFTFLIFILDSYENDKKIVKMFLNFGGYFNFFLVFIQFFSLNQNILSYGMTPLKYMMLVESEFIIIVSFTSALKKRKFLKYNLLLLSFISLLITVTPMNVIDVSLREKHLRLVKILKKNNMVIGEEIVSNPCIEKKDKEEISRLYDNIHTLDYNKKINLPYNHEDFEKVFGFRHVKYIHIPVKAKKINPNETFKYDF